MASEVLLMTKGQGYTTIGAVLLAGIMFRGSMNVSPSDYADKTKDAILTAAEKPETGEGPWLASCRYWAVVRTNEPSAATTPPKIDFTLKPAATGIEGSITGLSESPATCGNNTDPWGIPENSSATPEIHAIIATVTDPVHSHLALEFDRSIDAILQAAADNGYLASSYWLPWPSPSLQPISAQPSAADQAAQRKRELQPGLIILKYSPAAGEPDAAETSFYRVVYLFLVAESPALGMNGEQLRNALQYEANFRNTTKSVTLSMSKANDEMAFIGPHWSGSAAALSQALLAATSSGGVLSAEPDGQQIKNIEGAGATSSEIAQCELNAKVYPNASRLQYLSFGEDTSFEENRLVHAFNDADKDANKTAVLVEDNTVYGAANSNVEADIGNPCGSSVPANTKADPTQVAKPSATTVPKPSDLKPIYIRFPREISLLRNAQPNTTGNSSQPPSPYLSFSLKDPGSDDLISKFSSAQTALSQEAQLMEIERRLQKLHVRHILISASNVLDEIFLARELRRACPNASIIFYNGGDLLVERDVDNAPYIGSLTVSPYGLFTFDPTLGRPSQSSDPSKVIVTKPETAPDEMDIVSTKPDSRVFSDARSASVYNAASYIFWWHSDDPRKPYNPPLTSTFRVDSTKQQFPLLVTVVGIDGYYPLGILSPCASDSTGMLKNIDGEKTPPCDDKAPVPQPSLPSAVPALAWYLICCFVFALSVTHAIAMVRASYWSEWTRDLAVKQNDQPMRRAVYIHIGNSMLISMALVLTIPWFVVGSFTREAVLPWCVAVLTLLSALLATVFTLVKTNPYLRKPKSVPDGHQITLYPFFNRLAVAAVIVVLILMRCICLQDHSSLGSTYAGYFFSYRCLHPISGISPVTPILLLLFAWYLWAGFQTARLRFSPMNRPRLPGPVTSTSSYPLYVADQSLQRGKSKISHYLVENIDSLLITRTLAQRVTGWQPGVLNWALGAFYFVLFLICAFGLHIESLGRFLHSQLPHQTLTAYEWLIAIFFYPLVMIALSGWCRVLLIWSELKGGLLEPLERMPFRLAFSRVSEVNWVTMLSQSGLSIRWRDMARSTESVRQIMHSDKIVERAGPVGSLSLKSAEDELNRQIAQLQLYLGVPDKSDPRFGHEKIKHEKDEEEVYDLPSDDCERDLCFIYALENRYASFGERLLQYVLLPYWSEKRIGLINEVDLQKAPNFSPTEPDPAEIHLAEEFLVIRYVAFIRTVLVNVRHLMLFVSLAFVLAIVCWNSYPFQPRQQLDWCFTVLMLCIGSGFVWVFAQMHRNPILSRITATTPGELGSDFYVRMITFGAVPVLTWLAYQFPEFGGGLFRLLQPSLAVAK
jgi:hypothetical protein